MKAYRCDRCGAYFGTEPTKKEGPMEKLASSISWLFGKNQSHIWTMTVEGENASGMTAHDLCPACEDSLRRWFDHPEEHQEAKKVRHIDADRLELEFEAKAREARRWKADALNNGNEESTIRVDATLVFLSEVKNIINKAPTIEPEKICVANIHMKEDQIREAVDRAKNEILELGQSLHHAENIIEFLRNTPCATASIDGENVNIIEWAERQLERKAPERQEETTHGK